ncbi:hypothetical protein D3C73_1634370 [compost metagenome]
MEQEIFRLKGENVLIEHTGSKIYDVTSKFNPLSIDWYLVNDVMYLIPNEEKLSNKLDVF